jgi:16S rRNA (guanine527-N7)-methyltransferase
MTEDEAQGWVRDWFGPAAYTRMEAFTQLLIAENVVQNLISPSSVASLWARHVVDSAQLLNLASPAWINWIDIGTGGGFPGLVISLLAPNRPVTLVEPRRKRAEFLQHCVSTLALPQVRVAQSRIEMLAEPHDIISARAVAAVDKLLEAAHGCAHKTTRWLLPRGQMSGTDANFPSGATNSMFHVEHSITDERSAILVIDGDGR